MRQILFLMGALLFSFAAPVFAEVIGETVTYRDAETVLEGYYAASDTLSGSLTGTPGILVVHEWKGLNEYAKSRTRQLAELGYSVFAADMYGTGVRPLTHEEAAKVSGIYRSDRKLMRRRALAALDELKKRPGVDKRNIAAIGYCFGGTTVIEIARSGADVKGVASFHGGLDSPTPQDGENIKAKVLVLNGAEDKFTSPENLAAFEKEMKDANVDYKRVDYPGAVHSFTVPEAGSDPSTGMAYNAEADQQSWEELQKFLKEIFA